MLCAPEATRPDSRTTLQYVHSTLTWAHKSGPRVAHTASRMRNMVVKGWSVGSPLIGGSRRLRWRLLGTDTQGRRVVLFAFVRKTFHTPHALRCLCEGIDRPVWHADERGGHKYAGYKILQHSQAGL